MRTSALGLVCLSLLVGEGASAGSIDFGFAVANFSSNPQNYSFLFGKPYVDGPIGVVQQSIGVVGVDATGDGFGLTNLTLDTLIDNVVVHTTSIADCTSAGGAAGGTFSCTPGGSQWATTDKVISESGAGPIGLDIAGSISAGDSISIVFFGSLSGVDVQTGEAVSPFIVGSVVFQNFLDLQQQFNLLYSEAVPDARYSSASLNLAAVILDLNGGGASAEIDAQLSFGGNLLSLGIQDACAVNNGVLSGTVCRGGPGFGPSTIGVSGPATGLFGQQVKFTLTGNEDGAGIVGGAQWGPGTEIPEPGTWAMMIGGAALLVLRSRKR